MRPRLLDLFCGAGGAGMGYHQAGFDVVGVDLSPQPRYPFRFHRVDALVFPLGGFDVIHASPPCQASSRMRSRWQGREYPQLIGAVRDRLQASGVPYVIENVDGAPLVDPIVLCGSMFGLEVRRHRLFESSIDLRTPSCDHASQGYVYGVYGHSGASADRGRAARAGRSNSVADWRRAMGIDWMTQGEITESIPPAYTEFIGHQLMAVVR